MATHTPKKILIVEDEADISQDGWFLPFETHFVSLRQQAAEDCAARPLAEFVKLALRRREQKIVVDQVYYPLPTMGLNRLSTMWITPVRAAAAEGPAKIHN